MYHEPHIFAKTSHWKLPIISPTWETPSPEKPTLTWKSITRLSKANSAFGRLRKKVWDRRGISQDSKLKVYMAVVLTCYMHVSHGLCTAATPEKNSTTSTQNVCGLFWASSGKTWSLTQKSPHEQASLALPLYCRKLKWDGQATWHGHGCLMTACQNSSYMASSAMANDQLVGKRNASRTPLRKPSQDSTLMSPTGKSVPSFNPCGAVWFLPEQ